MTTALLKALPDVTNVTLPYIVKDKLLLTVGKWNGKHFPASAIKAKSQELADDPDSFVPLYEGAVLDHQDSTGTLCGETRSHTFDGTSLRGDLYFITAEPARKAKWAVETKHPLEGISPRMSTNPPWGSIPIGGTVKQIVEFKSFGIVLDPAMGSQAMLARDKDGRLLLGDGPVVLLEDVTLPFPNEHAARLKTPESLTPFIRIRRTEGSGDGTVQGVKVPESISVVWYIIERDGKEVPVAQTLRFPTETWTEAEARKWLKDNKIKPILFEPASEAEESNIDKNKEKEVSELKKLFCEKCDLLFDEGAEKCSKCEGELKEADEATVARLEKKAADEAQAKKDADAAAEKKKAVDAKAKKDADAADVAEAQKQKDKEYPLPTYKERPYWGSPLGYRRPYYGKAEGAFHKEAQPLRTHVLSRKPALDQVADLEELTQDIVGFCGAVLKAFREEKLDLGEAVMEMGAILREVPQSAELSKEPVEMDEAVLALVRENEGHKKAEFETEIKTIIDEGHKLASAVREDVEALLSISADAILSEEGETVDVAEHFRKIVASLPIGAALSLDKKSKRLVSTEAKLSKDEDKTPEEKRETGREAARESGLGSTEKEK